MRRYLNHNHGRSFAIAHNRCAWEAATVAIIRFSAMGAKVIRNVAIERLKAAAEQMPNKHEPVRSDLTHCTRCRNRRRHLAKTER